MFSGATVFNSDIGSWNVTDMKSMFQGATAFESDISNWTVSKVQDMNYMMEELIGDNITHWVFGHMYKKYNEKINNTLLICNPRGRLNGGFKDFDILRLVN